MGGNYFLNLCKNFGGLWVEKRQPQRAPRTHRGKYSIPSSNKEERLLNFPLWSRSCAPAPAKYCDRLCASALQCVRRHRVVVGAAGRGAWLLKYIICVIFQPQSTQSAQSVFTFICMHLRPSVVNFCRNPAPFVPSLSLCPASLHYTLPPQPVRAAGWQPSVWIRASLEPQINANKRRYCR